MSSENVWPLVALRPKSFQGKDRHRDTHGFKKKKKKKEMSSIH